MIRAGSLSARVGAAVGPAVMLAILAGCAGPKEGAQAGAEVPGGSAANAPPPGTGASAVPEGKQYSVSDALSSGEPGAPRPEMNAEASGFYQAGMQAFRVGDLQGAKTQFQKATQADGRAYKAFYSLGVVSERLRENAAALSAYKKAVSVVPDYELAIVAYAVLLANTERASEAESFLNQKLSKMPKSAALSAGLAEVKSIQGDSAAAQRHAREALKKNPDYRPAMVVLARDHYRNRRLDLALYSLKGILDGFGAENPPRDKDNAEARLLRALIYKEQNARKLAIEEFKRALELRADLVEARVQLAAYYLEAGDAAEAAQLLEGALRYDEYHLLARLNLGDAYRLLGKTQDARQQLEWVKSRDPSLAEVYYDLGLLYLFSESVPGLTPSAAADKAIEALEKYKELSPRGTAGPDDSDELITRAKTKKALVEAKQAEAAQQANQPSGNKPIVRDQPF